MTSTNCWLRSAALFSCVLLGALQAPAQISSPLRAVTPQPVFAQAGQSVSATVYLQLTNGYHINSNVPTDPYLIPLKVTWDSAPLQVSGVDFPKPHMEKYPFSAQPLSVFSSDFEVVTHFKVPAGTPKGARKVTGKILYQACTTNMCLSPRTITVELPVQVR